MMGWLLGFVGLLTCVAVLWLRFGHGIRFLGPFPTLLLFLVPLHAGMLAFAWADRARHPGMFKMAVVVAILVALISPLLLRWG